MNEVGPGVPDEGSKGWLFVWSDGASRGNPGPAGIGGVAREPGGTLVVKVCEFIGEATNNVAEYNALMRVLEEAAGRGYDKVKIFTDSSLMANQLTGGFRVKSKALLPLMSRLKFLLTSFREVRVEHIPREENSESDALANRAIDEGLAGGTPSLPKEDPQGFLPLTGD